MLPSDRLQTYYPFRFSWYGSTVKREECVPNEWIYETDLIVDVRSAWTRSRFRICEMAVMYHPF